MIGRFILSIVVLAGMTGCATTRTGPNEYLELRISQLERELQDKDDQISLLEDEIERLEEKIVKTKSPSIPRSEYIDLSQEGRPRTGIVRVNQSVEEIQTLLSNAGFYQGKIDGKIGDLTKSAIIDFQKANDLKVDGIVGLETWAKLREYAE